MHMFKYIPWEFMCLPRRLERSIFLGVSSTQHALLLPGVRWYNVDVWSVKRSLVLSPAWWHGTVVLSPAPRLGMLIPLPQPICPPAEGLMKARGHLVQTANIHQWSNMSNAEAGGESSSGRRKVIGSVKQGLTLTNTSALVLLVEMFGQLQSSGRQMHYAAHSVIPSLSHREKLCSGQNWLL